MNNGFLCMSLCTRVVLRIICLQVSLWSRPCFVKLWEVVCSYVWMIFLKMEIRILSRYLGFYGLRLHLMQLKVLHFFIVIPSKSFTETSRRQTSYWTRYSSLSMSTCCLYQRLKRYWVLSFKQQDFNAKLSDFGLARDGPMGEQSYVSTRVMGTFGYAAPEYVSTGTFCH